MASQITIGLLTMCLTAYIHMWMLGIALTAFSPLSNWVHQKRSAFRLSAVMATTMVWVMAAHLLEVGLWAVVFQALGIFNDVSTSLYFSLVAYTTLGFGDIILPENWRLLSGLAAANGFLVFGWSTAFQVDLLGDLKRDAVEN
ncbi:MAG: ion channel [Pseudomonadota bacterium]